MTVTASTSSRFATIQINTFCTVQFPCNENYFKLPGRAATQTRTTREQKRVSATAAFPRLMKFWCNNKESVVQRKRAFLYQVTQPNSKWHRRRYQLLSFMSLKESCLWIFSEASDLICYLTCFWYLGCSDMSFI